MNNNNKILWKPKPEDIDQSQLSQFVDFINVGLDIAIPKIYNSIWEWSVKNSPQFWSKIWDFSGIIGKKGDRILIDPHLMPGAKFFPDATLNYAENLLTNSNNPIAIISHREDGEKIVLSNKDLRIKVMLMAGWLKAKGVNKGDRVAAYMPNCIETVITMLATASLGAIFSSCSTDFGVSGVLDRFSQIEPKILVTVDGYLYNGKTIRRSNEINQIVDKLPSLKYLVVLNYINEKIDNKKFIDFSEVYKANPLENFIQVKFNDPLCVVFSSGTTGAPKCIVHSVGGVLLQHSKEHKLQADIKAGDKVFYFSTCGWMMWNWLVGALSSNATIILYEGSPFYNSPSRLWDLVDEDQINLFGTSAKYIDAIRKSGFIPKAKNNLNSLKSLLSTGSPLSPESFEFINNKINSKIQIGSISGGTDILSCFVLNNPFDSVVSGEIQSRGLGLDVCIFNEKAEKIISTPGELVCTNPFPSMPVMFWNDPDNSKYTNAYFNYFPNVWRHGDWAEISEKGSMIIYGRSDATLNPGGVRIGTAEIYRHVENFPEIIEALVIGQQWEEDTRIVLFIKLAEKIVLNEDLISKIKSSVKKDLSPRHVPAKILSVNDIPRTRSGKITELAVRDIIHGKQIKNIEALANPEALEQFKNIAELKI